MRAALEFLQIVFIQLSAHEQLVSLWTGRMQMRDFSLLPELVASIEEELWIIVFCRSCFAWSRCMWCTEALWHATQSVPGEASFSSRRCYECVFVSHLQPSFSAELADVLCVRHPQCVCVCFMVNDDSVLTKPAGCAFHLIETCWLLVFAELPVCVSATFSLRANSFPSVEDCFGWCL